MSSSVCNTHTHTIRWCSESPGVACCCFVAGSLCVTGLVVWYDCTELVVIRCEAECVKGRSQTIRLMCPTSNVFTLLMTVNTFIYGNNV